MPPNSFGASATSSRARRSCRDNTDAIPGRLRRSSSILPRRRPFGVSQPHPQPRHLLRAVRSLVLVLRTRFHNNAPLFRGLTLRLRNTPWRAAAAWELPHGRSDPNIVPARCARWHRDVPAPAQCESASRHRCLVQHAAPKCISTHVLADESAPRPCDVPMPIALANECPTAGAVCVTSSHHARSRCRTQARSLALSEKRLAKDSSTPIAISHRRWGNADRESPELLCAPAIAKRVLPESVIQRGDANDRRARR